MTGDRGAPPTFLGVPVDGSVDRRVNDLANRRAETWKKPKKQMKRKEQKKMGKFKSLSRTTQLAIIIAIILSISIVAYAAISALISKTVTTNLTRGDLTEMELDQPVVTGTVVPGDSVGINPSITNTGTKDCLAFIKVSMPTIPSYGSNAYTMTVNSGWTKVA